MTKKLTSHFLLFTLLLLLSCWHSTVLALSASEAAEQARSQTGGKILRVQTKSDGRYRVKVLMPSGQVRNVSVGDSSPENFRRDNDDRTDKKSKTK